MVGWVTSAEVAEPASLHSQMACRLPRTMVSGVAPGFPFSALAFVALVFPHGKTSNIEACYPRPTFLFGIVGPCRYFPHIWKLPACSHDSFRSGHFPRRAIHQRGLSPSLASHFSFGARAFSFPAHTPHVARSDPLRCRPRRNAALPLGVAAAFHLSSLLFSTPFHLVRSASLVAFDFPKLKQYPEYGGNVCRASTR